MNYFERFGRRLSLTIVHLYKGDNAQEEPQKQESEDMKQSASESSAHFLSPDFELAAQNGLSSDNFDIRSQNATDSRPGLDQSEDILNIMESLKCTFDEARLVRQQRLMLLHNIDPLTGIPRDPKCVIF
jgi:hypothetical protein